MRIKTIFMMLNILLSLHIALIANAQTNGPYYGGTIVVGLPADPGTLAPQFTTAYATGEATSYICYESLLKYDFDLNPKPCLAESWEVAADGLVYTFHLIRNATWHDGVPFTSADVKFSIEEILLKHHPMGRSVFGNLDRVVTPDNYTVILMMKAPFAPLLDYYLQPHAAPIVPKHIYEGTDYLNNTANSAPIGTGPFKFVEYVKGERVVWERNDNYWKSGRPYADTVVMKVIVDKTAMKLAMLNGEVDWWPIYVEPAFVADMNDTTKGVIITQHGGEAWGTQTLLSFNLLRDLPIANKLVRKAIDYALDKELIVELSTFGTGLVSYSLIPPQCWAINPNVPRYEYNTTKANELLDQAGYPKGQGGTRFSLTLSYDSEVAMKPKIAEIIKEQLKLVGIDINLDLKERVAHLEAESQRNFDIALSWFSCGGDPHAMTGRFITTDQIRPGVPMTNIAGYSNATVDQLYQNASVEMDREARKQMYWEAQMIYMDDLPYIPMAQAVFLTGYSTDIQGEFPTSPFSREGFADNWLASAASVTQPSWIEENAIWIGVIVVIIVATVAGAIVFRRRRRK